MIHHKQHSETALQVAAYVVGCLVHEGCIRIDQERPDPYEVIESSVRIIAASLDASGLIDPDQDAPSLPIEW
jgi:hypothetical protein